MVERRPRMTSRESRRSRVQSPAGAPTEADASHWISVGKAEILGAMLGDKRRFAIRRRYEVKCGKDQSRYLRGSLEISLGNDLNWGRHLSRLLNNVYGISGSIYRSKREWILEVSSMRVVLDLSKYFSLEWKAKTWRVPKVFFQAPAEIRGALLRGYFDAEGYVQVSPRRIEIHASNRDGLSDTRTLLGLLGISSKIYTMRTGRSWKLHIPAGSLPKFKTSVGFSIARKQRVLETIVRPALADS